MSLINDLIGIKEVSFQSIEPNTVQQTLNGRDIVQSMASQKWRFDVTTKVMSESEMMPLLAHVVSQAGAYGEFQFKIPIGSKTATVTAPQTVSVASQSGDVDIDIQESTTLRVGTFIQFSNHSKIYMVKTTTSGAFTIYPKLVSDIDVGDNVVIYQPTCNVRFIGDMTPFTITNTDLTQSYDFTLIEVI